MDITITLTDDEWSAVQIEAETANATRRMQPDVPPDTPADAFFVQQVRDRIVVFWQANQARAVREQKLALADQLSLDVLQTAVAQVAVSIDPVAMPPVKVTL